MSTPPTGRGTPWWAKNLHQIDQEIARLATICSVRILDPGVIERVLRNDADLCGPVDMARVRRCRFVFAGNAV